MTIPRTSLQDTLTGHNPPTPKTLKPAIRKLSRCTEHSSIHPPTPSVNKHHCLSVRKGDYNNHSTTRFASKYLWYKHLLKQDPPKEWKSQDIHSRFLHNAIKQQKTSRQMVDLPCPCSAPAQQSSSTDQDITALAQTRQQRRKKNPIQRSSKLSTTSVKVCKIALPFLHVTGNLKVTFV